MYILGAVMYISGACTFYYYVHPLGTFVKGTAPGQLLYLFL